MSKKHIIGIIVILIGLFMMGFEMGRSSKSGVNNDLLHYVGLCLTFIGIFIVSINLNLNYALGLYLL